MARDAGANKVTFARPRRRCATRTCTASTCRRGTSWSPTAARSPRSPSELGADYMVYQEVADLQAAILEGSDVEDLDMSCFTADYITGTVTEEYLAWVERPSSAERSSLPAGRSRAQPAKPLATSLVGAVGRLVQPRAPTSHGEPTPGR